jgi:lactose/raffinose/galactose permease
MGIVGIVAVAAGMTGNAKPADITASGINQFNTYMFYIPIVLLVIAAIIFFSKVTLTEARHEEIVKELKKRLSKNNQNEVNESHTAETKSSKLSPSGITH